MHVLLLLSVVGMDVSENLGFSDVLFVAVSFFIFFSHSTYLVNGDFEKQNFLRWIDNGLRRMAGLEKENLSKRNQNFYDISKYWKSQL